ncbi:MAG: hypothetical protein ABIA04_08575 [Pseudomonadota bacterium]
MQNGNEVVRNNDFVSEFDKDIANFALATKFTGQDSCTKYI